eukprot:366086-Chlamydomonas_euryale.AAC.15
MSAATAGHASASTGPSLGGTARQPSIATPTAPTRTGGCNAALLGKERGQTQGQRLVDSLCSSYWRCPLFHSPAHASGLAQQDHLFLFPTLFLLTRILAHPPRCALSAVARRTLQHLPTEPLERAAADTRARL